MKRFIEILATALMTAAFLVAFILILVLALDEPIYGTQQHAKPVSYKPAVCNQVMT